MITPDTQSKRPPWNIFFKWLLEYPTVGFSSLSLVVPSQSSFVVSLFQPRNVEMPQGMVLLSFHTEFLGWLNPIPRLYKQHICRWLPTFISSQSFFLKSALLIKLYTHHLLWMSSWHLKTVQTCILHPSPTKSLILVVGIATANLFFQQAAYTTNYKPWSHSRFLFFSLTLPPNH